MHQRVYSRRRDIPDELWSRTFMRTFTHRGSSGREPRSQGRLALRGISVHFQALFPAVAFAAWIAPTACAQVNPIELRTGSGQIVATELHSVGTGASTPLPSLRFEFGFATDDALKPQSFSDSFTVSLENGLGQRVYIATTSISGTVWAPFVPGAIPLASDRIHSVAVAYAVDPHPAARTEAYAVEVAVPSSWTPHEIRLRFDLFDNLDERPSAAYFRHAELVPEPGVLALSITALIAAGTVAARRPTRPR